MPDLDSLPVTRDLPVDYYTVVVTRVFHSRGVLFPPERVVMFSVLDPDPQLKPEDSRHPHKAFTGRTVTARFALQDPNAETRNLAAAQFALLCEAAGTEDLVGKVLRVRVARLLYRADPSRFVTRAVEFLPHEF